MQISSLKIIKSVALAIRKISKQC